MIAVRPQFLILGMLALALGCDTSSAPIATTQGIAPAKSTTTSASLVSTGRSLPVNSKGLIDCSFDDIKFELENNDDFERSKLTPQIEDLFGKRIRIRGYIFPTLKKKGLTQFVLVRDNLECCFGPGAALFDCIMIQMEPGKTAEYTIRPIAVEGRFEYELVDFDGTIVAIYKLIGEKAE